MYTEAEAKTKWCPQMNSEEAFDLGETHVNCCASHCMAWRWIGSKGPEQQGYCGLAGRP
jgi:hypothetical protein